MGMFMGLGVVVSTVVYHYKENIWYLDSVVAILIALLLFVTGIRYQANRHRQTDRLTSKEYTFYRMLKKLLSKRGKFCPPVG